MPRSRAKNQAQTPILLEEGRNESSFITELRRIMSLKNKKIDFKLVSKKHYPSIQYTVRATCDDLITFGYDSNLEEAKKKSALAFWTFMNSKTNNTEIPSTSFTPNSIIEDPQEPVYCNKNNIVTPSSSYDLSVKPSFVYKKVFHDSNTNESVTTQLASCSLNDESLRKQSLTTSTFNPINELQELCLSHHWMLPTYNLINDGPKHNPILTVKCILSTYTYFGVGDTEQTAKIQAATNMLNKIKSLSQKEMNNIPNNIYEYGLAKDSGHSFLFENINDMGKEKVYTAESIKLLEMYFKTSLEHGDNKKFNLLNIPKMKAVDVLDKITKQRDVSTKYVIYPEDSSGVKVLIQILTFPIFVCMGFGETKTEAQEKAANSALTYFKYQIDNKII